MKVAVATSTLAEAGVEAQTTFGMDTTSEAFRILSSGLYSDKISAVLREVSCNALDAHVVAGTPDLPIEVQLPTVLDHTLRIRDHGRGLDEKRMVETYTRYFKSDKRESNDLIGGKGLGSKSPFCYIDSFNVTTVQNGEKRMYVAHVGAHGVPVLSLMGRAPADADWPHGLEVSFPVKPKDITEFHTKAPMIFRWFRVLPKIIGGLPIEPVAIALDGDTFAIVPAEVSGCRLLMGNVAYPIHLESVPGLTDVEKHLLQNGLILKAPIGSVSPTASREGLEYSPADRAALKRLIAASMDELREMLKALALHEEATEWLTRRRLHAKLSAAGPGAPSHPVVVKGMFERGAEPIVIREKIMRRLLDTLIRAPEAVGSSGETRVFAYGYFRGKGSTVSRTEVSGGAFSDRHRTPLMLRYEASATVVVMDLPGADRRIRTKFRAKGRAWAAATVIGVIGPAALEKAKMISEVFGGLKIINASSWPAPERPKRDPSVKTSGLKGDGVKHYVQVIRGVDNPEGRGWIKLGQPSEDIDPVELGESGKYYIVARDTPEKCTEFLNRTEAAGRYITVDLLGALWKAYEEARCQGVDLPLIEGVLVLETAQSCRSLEKEGWRDLVVAMRERLLEKRGELVAGFFAVPNIWSKYEVYCSWYRMEHYGVAAVLADIEVSSDAWKACEPVVQARPVFAQWVSELRALKEGLRADGSVSARRQVALREHLNAAAALLGHVHEGRIDCSVLASNDSMEKRRYPGLTLLDTAWFHRVLTDAELAANIPQAASMLQAALSFEIEA